MLCTPRCELLIENRHTTSTSTTGPQKRRNLTCQHARNTGNDVTARLSGVRWKTTKIRNRDRRQLWVCVAVINAEGWKTWKVLSEWWSMWKTWLIVVLVNVAIQQCKYHRSLWRMKTRRSEALQCTVNWNIQLYTLVWSRRQYQLYNSHKSPTTRNEKTT